MKCRKILSEKRRNEVIEYYRKKKSELYEGDDAWLGNYVEIMAELSRCQMSTAEILETNDSLYDMLSFSRAETASMEEIGDAGRLLLGGLNQMRCAKELSEEGKRWLVFCVCTVNYKRVPDDESDQTLTGLVLFTSTERIRELYQAESGLRYFVTADHFPAYDTEQPLGYSPDNPVLAVTPWNAAYYLTHLRPKDGRLTIRRIGVVKGFFGEPLVSYELTVRKDPFSSDDEKKYSLFVNECSMENTRKAPDGFSCA